MPIDNHPRKDNTYFHIQKTDAFEQGKWMWRVVTSHVTWGPFCFSEAEAFDAWVENVRKANAR